MRRIVLTVMVALFVTNPLGKIFSQDTKQNSFEFGTEDQVKEALNWENRIYLATYPRSGNHWMRYLIEEATHIATSSTYCDPDPQHLKTVFSWGGYCCDHGYEGICSYPEEGEKFVVKTHFPTMHISSFDDLPYLKTVRVVRHPVDSIYSLYFWVQNYKNQPAEHMVPRDFLLKSINSWLVFQQYWNQAENVLTIRYEDLYNNPVEHLTLVLDTIGYEVTEEDIQRAVSHYPPTGGLNKHSEHFTEEDLSLINDKLGPLMELYGYPKISRVIN